MILFKRKAALQSWLLRQREKNQTIGFVPTMGALHSGHISLLETSKKENPVTVCSIFVNPSQFNDESDFEKYPVTIEKDIQMLELAGCDVLFLPSVKEIYPHGFSDIPAYDLGDLESVLEGAFRPGHYQGVCMVVHRLLEAVMPDQLYLGQKDFQQCMVITRLIDILGLAAKISISICPTLRETDGLAMSSRNMRLNKTERQQAPSLYKALTFIRDNQYKFQPGALTELATKQLEKEGFKVDYVAIADAASLAPVTDWKQSENPVALVAAYLNEIRLIDNMVLN